MKILGLDLENNLFLSVWGIKIGIYHIVEEYSPNLNLISKIC